MSFVIGSKPSPMEETLVDSKEGIEHLMRWAKAGRYVMSPVHAAIARKYGVSTEGVVFSGKIPRS